MRPDVQREYDEILAQVVIQRGMVLHSASRSMFAQYDYTNHLGTCGVRSHSTPSEDTWSEFQGTFADDHSVHGITVKVTCRCGHYVDRMVRWQTNVSEIAEAVFTALYEKMRGE